ncbi:MAG: NAD-dependent epimerase/dehydratase family protein [Planctomycetota bacterium]
MNLQGATVAVTGASGMLGVYLCRSLLARGANVRGVVRNPRKAPFLEAEGVTFATANLNDRDALTAAFRGCDAIVSNAALFSMTNQNWEANYSANKTGTENVYHAAHAAGVKRMVHISTFGVYRWRIWGAPKMAEDNPRLRGERGEMGPTRVYRATKNISEQLAWSLAKEFGMDLTVLRPTGVYGARDTQSLAAVRAFSRLPVLVLPAMYMPMTFGGDVGDAAAAALATDISIGKAYNTGGDAHRITRFISTWRRVNKHWFPLVIPLPTFGIGLRTDSSLAAAELGFRNRPFEEGMRELIEDEAKNPLAS